MRGIVLVCGTNVPLPPGFSEAQVTRVPERPGKADVDASLPTPNDDSPEPGADVIVVGTDADLAAVVLRLLRKNRLANTSIGYVPLRRRSQAAALWGLPPDQGGALELARTGTVHQVPVIRDDAGGVLIARGTLTKVDGVVYCDDDVALRGTAKRIEVRPDLDGGPGLVVKVVRRALFRRSKVFRPRALQLGSKPTVPVLDGLPRDRPVQRWTWYRHTEDLRIVR